MDEANAGHERFDDVDLLQRCDDQQLQIELLEQAKPVLRRLVRAAPKRLVDDDEAKRPRTHGAPLQPELVGQACGQHGVGELLLLPTGLATRVGIVFVLDTVGTPTLTGRKQESVAHVGHLGGPAPVGIRQSLSSTKSVNDAL